MDNKETKFSFDFEKLLDYLKENKKVTAVICLVAVLIIVMIAAAVGGKNSTESGDASGDASGDVVAFAVNEDQGIIDLMTNYYTAYANNDIDTLSTLATPISDLEKEYIALMSGYVDHYDNINVYVKPGLTEGAYLVSVSMDMYFTDIATCAPGVETYYVETNEDGSYYINNLYSWFNLSTGELEADQTIADRIASFEEEDDVIALFSQIQTAYTEALAADEALSTMMNDTIPNAISSWLASYNTSASADVAETTDETTTDVTTDETTTDETTTDETTTDETTTDETTTDETATEDDATAETDTEDTSTTVEGLDEGDNIYLTEAVIVRSSMSETSDRVGTAYSGETLVVVMSYEEGWTKVTWGTKIGYVKTEVLQEQ